MSTSNSQRIQWSVLSAFFSSGLLASAIFAGLIISTRFQSFWFRSEEFWIMPTRNYWLMAGGLFWFSLAIPYSIAQWKGWVSFSKVRVAAGAVMLALLPAAALIATGLPFTWQIVVFRFSVALILSLTLLIVTRNWYTSISATMLIISLVSPFIAGIPFLLDASISNAWFECLRFMVNSITLSTLFGYWLAKPNTRAKRTH